MSQVETTVEETDERPTIESKHVATSMSAWGAIAAATPVIAQLVHQMFGTDVAPDVLAHGLEVAHQTVQTFHDGYANLIELYGIAQMVVGRVNAKQPLHFIPGASFEIDAVTRKRIVPVKPMPLTPDVARIMDRHPVLPTPPTIAEPGAA